jgi:predicted O-methyltransferase YrrM
VKIEKIREVVSDIPHMTHSQGESITNLILDNRFSEILELGFRHGVSTCYMAGALDELGTGHVTTIDLTGARDANPSIETLLHRLELESYVTTFYEPTSYIWRLMKMLEESPRPRFDFCYIDGAHSWITDGFAFFLVDRLLMPGGLIVFDDLDWTYEKSPALGKSDMVRLMPEAEKTTAQIRKVFELLVTSHPSYGDFMEKEGWAYARKSTRPVTSAEVEVKKHIVYEKKTVIQKEFQYVGLGGLLANILRRIYRHKGA